MGFIHDFFSFFKDKEQTHEPTKRQRRYPVVVDFTDSLQCNAALTQGLYHNSYPGMKLAGSMAFTPIAVPVWFMGLPVPRPAQANETLQALINELVEQNMGTMKAIHTITHRDGTCWIWPYFSSKQGRVVWQYVPDEIVTDIIRDVDTGEIIRLIAEEDLTVSVSFGTTAQVKRHREWTREEYIVQWQAGAAGIVPGELVSGAARNVLGILPIAFANNRDLGRVRGHSDYERILSDLKVYHDVDLANSTTLAQFRVKLVQTTKNIDQWMYNNSYSDKLGGDITKAPDVSRDDLILNLPEEKTEYVFPKGATEAYEKDMERRFYKIIEGSGIPEILWGPSLTGNHASSEEQMGVLVKFINDKQEQKSEEYRRLFAASLALLSRARIQSVDTSRITIEWNPMDAISEKVKGEIFKNFAQGMAALFSAAAVTPDIAHKLWNNLYPSATDDDFDTFVTGLQKMARHKAFSSAPWETLVDMQGGGLEDEGTPPPGNE